MQVFASQLKEHDVIRYGSGSTIQSFEVVNVRPGQMGVNLWLRPVNQKLTQEVFLLNTRKVEQLRSATIV